MVMMNVPKDVVRSVTESLKGTPFVMAIVILNVLSLVGFAYTLHEVGDAIERRDAIIKACAERAR